MKKILLVGGTGGLGSKIVKNFDNKFKCISVGSKVCNVMDEIMVSNYIDSIDFDIVIYLSVKNINGLIHRQTNESINQQLNVNISGFLNVLRSCTPKLREKGYGRIIYLSSILSKKPIKGAGIYAASKSFCESIVRTYALENASYGITANAIQLGYFDVGLIKEVPKHILDNVIDTIPQKRLGKSDEITSLIETIIDTEYINGVVLTMAGGL
jgi:3-oxoacyl-[acyl-carrier protein] reductase